jgi:hypothetical protein
LTVGGVFLVWALGPFLTIGGLDSGLKLPQLAAQFIPIVSNAHMPGRAIVGVFLALAVLVGLRVSRAEGPLRRPAVQWLAIAGLIVEYADAPIPLTGLDRPAVYERLAGEPAGAVCEVPFGVGDGLGVGVGAQDRRILYYATIHGHPLAGGYVGRMPHDVAQRYAALPVTQSLLRLSDEHAPDVQRTVESVPSSETPSETSSAASLESSSRSSSASVCTYLVLDRSRASPRLVAYVESLPVLRLANSDERDLFRLRPPR